MMNHTTFNSELTRAEQTLQQPLETSNIDITEQPIGTAGDDYLYAQSGNDILSGRAGNDYIYSYIEEVRGNIFLGEAGSDTLYGGGGNDALFGGEGNDYLAGSQYNPNEDTYSDFRIIALNCLSDNKSIFFKSDRSKQSF